MFNWYYGGNNLKFRLIALFSILLCILIIPATFAADNDTEIGINDDASVILENTFDEDILTVNEYYFDANAENDRGNGSINNPYKTVNDNRLSNNSIAHFANGEYVFGYIKKDNLTIIGQNPSKTIFTSGYFYVSSSLTLNNVTLTGASINDLGDGEKLIAVNSILSDFTSSGLQRINAKNANVTLDNCTLKNNYAKSGSSYMGGGAIYMDGGVLYAKDTVFDSNHADYYGGAIYSKNDAMITLEDCTFKDNYAKYGGAIYIEKSDLAAENVQMINCSALSGSGGAIVSLNSNLNISKLNARNNKAKYDGGAIFSIYGTLNITSCQFESNTAENGGALYVDEVYDFIPFYNSFIKNTASNTGGAVYCDISESLDPNSVLEKTFNNAFIKNQANIENDVYESNLPNLNIGSNDYILIKYNSDYNGTLPSSYDLRNYGYVTSVKNQGNGGNCWAFAAIGALESCIIKATGNSYDLSENNMKNIMTLYSDYGWVMNPNDGGYDKMGVGYLTSWLGPINESDDEYNARSSLSKIFDSILHIQNIITLNRGDYLDNDEIKKAIMEYGAVATSIYWNSGSYAKGANYYNSGTSSANHAIIIVGWDDNYPKENFKTQPEGDGAWIIKNSWGASSGEKGYYYVSYYDKKCAPINKPDSIFTFILNDTIKYDKNYQYDIQGRTDYFYNTTNTVWYKNKFTATDNEYLAAVSTYFEKYTSWDLSIYVNNVLKLTKSGESHSGYTTIDLRKPITLSAGDVFEIVFKITVDGDAGVPISESSSLNREFYREGVSYVSYDGENWQDFYDLTWEYNNRSHWYSSQVSCIKAFTVFDKFDATVKISLTNQYNPCEITVSAYGPFGDMIDSGKVVFTVEGKTISANIVDGYAKITYAFNSLENNKITATFTSPGYNSATATKTITVKGTSINANDLTCYCGADIKFTASLSDSNGKAVSGKQIKFKVNNQEYVAKTNSNGVATVSPKLGSGEYDVVISFNDASGNTNYNVVKHISVKSKIELPVDTYTYNSEYKVRVLTTDGKPLTNSQVNMTVNSKTYPVITDENGFASLTLRLRPGTYDFTISIPDESKTQQVKVVSRISGNTALTMYYGAGEYYKVKVFDDNGKIAQGVVVTFKINGKTYTKTTNVYGWAVFKIVQNPGTYTITASYKGFSVSNKITVKPTLVLSTKTVKRYSTFSYTVKLLDKNGKILKAKQITVKFKGVTYKAKTNSKGIATFKIRAYSNTGKYTLTATYGTAKISKTITVKK